jgi:hypothetical protein
VKLACGTNNTGPADLGLMEYCLRMIRELGGHVYAADRWTEGDSAQAGRP